MSFGIKDMSVSIDRFAIDFIAEMRSLGVSETLEMYDFDARNDQAVIPDKDLFGPNGFAFDEQIGGIITLATAFISSTVNDRNGYRHIAIMDALHRKLRTGQMLPMYDSETGVLITQMKVIEASLGPTVRSEVRPMQGYAMRLLPAYVAG